MAVYVGFHIHPHCQLMIYDARLSLLRLLRKEAKSPTYFPIGLLSALLLSLGGKVGEAQDSKDSLRRGPEQTFKPRESL